MRQPTPRKLFHCTTVSETVSITLTRHRRFDGLRGGVFVQCSERDCQYVDTNLPPCPLTVDLFATDAEAARPPTS
jgi:hypothetical protein